MPPSPQLPTLAALCDTWRWHVRACRRAGRRTRWWYSWRWRRRTASRRRAGLGGTEAPLCIHVSCNTQTRTRASAFRAKLELHENGVNAKAVRRRQAALPPHRARHLAARVSGNSADQKERIPGEPGKMIMRGCGREVSVATVLCNPGDERHRPTLLRGEALPTFSNWFASHPAAVLVCIAPDPEAS